MEIERKFLIRQLPEHPEQYPCLQIEQGYLCTNPVVRIRKQDDSYFLTYKSGGLMTREEYNLPLTAESYAHLRKKQMDCSSPKSATVFRWILIPLSLIFLKVISRLLFWQKSNFLPKRKPTPLRPRNGLQKMSPIPANITTVI